MSAWWVRTSKRSARDFWLAPNQFRSQACRKKPASFFISMKDSTELKAQIKQMLVENLMLKIGASEIGDDQPLFGPGSLGLDSVDALQLVVALDKNYGLKFSDTEVARKAMQSVNTIATAIQEHQSISK
jgi:acyl carrier protein